MNQRDRLVESYFLRKLASQPPDRQFHIGLLEEFLTRAVSLFATHSPVPRALSPARDGSAISETSASEPEIAQASCRVS